jgi:hypothetical protein
MTMVSFIAPEANRAPSEMVPERRARYFFVSTGICRDRASAVGPSPVGRGLGTKLVTQTRYATCTPNHKVILLQVPPNRSRRGEPSYQSPGNVNDFTATCDLPAQGAGRGGTRHDPTTHMVHDGRAGDRRIGGDYRNLDLDWLITGLRPIKHLANREIDLSQRAQRYRRAPWHSQGGR